MTDAENRYMGLVHMKCEGAPVHPDDMGCEPDMSDTHYVKQLQAYKDYFGSIEEPIIRDRLKQEIK